MAIATLYVDVSAIDDVTAKMRAQLTPAQFDKLMRRTLKEVGAKAKTKAKKEVAAKYYGGTAFINSAIGSPKIEGGGASLTCRIVNKGPKGTIGGTFTASGGWYGWNPPGYSISANIVKGQVSVLPANMASYGGQPPFRNLGGKGFIGKNTKRKNVKLNKMQTGATNVYTRSGPAFHAKFRSVSALAVPQMIVNRAAPGIEKDIDTYAAARVVHNFNYMFNF